jgi:hypothetical protein
MRVAKQSRHIAGAAGGLEHGRGTRGVHPPDLGQLGRPRIFRRRIRESGPDAGSNGNRKKDERSCDRSTPDYVPQSQQDPTGFTAVSDPELVESSTFTTTRGPTVLNYGYAEARVDDDLDFGGWGYWHIRAGHGWSLADDADTRIALEDPTPIPATDRKGVDPYEFHGPKYPGKGGAVCRRVVLVDFGTTAGDPGPKGIITSYGADVNTLRVGYR